MYRYLLIALLSLGLLGLVSGCSESTSSAQDELDQIAAEFGGYMPTDEAPAFGDEELAASLAEDEEIDDLMLSDLAVNSIIDEAKDAGAYALRIIWGSMEYDSTVTEVTDWTGSLSVSRGAVISRRMIRFERGQDFIVDRTDRELIEWVSLTSVHNDGIFVNLYIPPAKIDDSVSLGTNDDPVTVTFETGPFTITYDISELAALDTIFQLEDSVNSVAFRAFKVTPRDCPKGFLEGRWGRDSTGQGVFRGRWMSQHGALAGHVIGHWGSDRNGNPTNIFYGKWIDVTGRFKGFLKGEYKQRPNSFAACCGGGWIKGHIYNSDRVRIGALRGHYVRARCDCNGRMGYFQARWKTFCPSIEAVDDGLED